MSFLSRLFASPPSGDQEALRLQEEVTALRENSRYFRPGTEADLAALILEDAGDGEDRTLGMRVGRPVCHIISKLYRDEPFSFVASEVKGDTTLSAQVALRARLHDAKRMLEAEEYIFEKWVGAVGGIVAGLFAVFPDEAFVDPDQAGNFDEFSALSPTVPLHTFIEDVPGILGQVIGTVFSHGLPEDGLFDVLRDQFRTRVCIASNLDPADPRALERRVVMPNEKRGLTDSELVDLYLTGTPFYDLFLLPIPLRIPEAVRFEHTHILAGTGHGKTQALQYLIAADLEKARSERRSIVVMDGQGDLLQTLLHSDYFRDSGLRDRLIYIDPTDVDLPVGINLFDAGKGLEGVSQVERETVLNTSVAFYEYFFGGLLGAELTQRQGLIFRYLATLLVRIPGANIHTLRELMEDGERFRPYIDSLDGSARAFFESRFFDRSFSETKKQISNRLWGVLSNASLDRMMSAKRSTVDLFTSLQFGSIIFINTAKDFLGHEGSVIFSRMFVALFGQALMRRASVARHERTPTYIYIDEAEDVVDTTLTRMLAQVRKYKGALTFAHQNLDQLAAEIRAGVLANTSIKLAGGVSAKDAQALAGDFRCDADFLLAQKKGRTETHFACYAKNVTERAISLSIPLGYLEGQKRLSEFEYQELIEETRTRYGAPVEVPSYERPRLGAPKGVAPEPVTEVEVPEPLVPAVPAQVVPMEPLSHTVECEAADSTTSTPQEEGTTSGAHVLVPQGVGGKGGVKHRYLQALVKELGEARGFLAVIEQQVHEGTGQVDVSLSRGATLLAFEISVTTTKDHELGNIEKCLALPYTHVVMLASHARHLKGLSTHITTAIDEGERKRVSFLLPEDVPGFLDGFPFDQPLSDRQVRGYTVRSKVKESDPVEALARRRAIAKVVGRSGM